MERSWHRPTLILLVLAAALAGPALAQTGIEVEELPEAGQPDSGSQPQTGQQAPVAPSQPGSIDERQAASAYASGDLPRALDLYRALAEREQDPQRASRLLLTAAWLSWQLEDSQGARETLERALTIDPSVPFEQDLYAPEFRGLYQDALRVAVHKRRVQASNDINQAVGEMRAGRYPQARRLLDEALSLEPADPDGLYNLALLDLREQHADAALAGFQKVLALERGNPEGVTRELKSQALNNSAVIYFARGDYLDAETALAEAVELDPGDAQSWFNLGLARQKLGKADLGYEALQRAHRIDGDDVEITRALAIVEIDRNDWVQAVAHLTETTRARPDDPDLRLLLGRAQRGLGNLQGAVESFRQALQLDPAGARGVGAPAALQLAESARGLGDLAAWTQAAETSTRLRPGDASGWLLLGLARQKAADLPGARDALEKARQLAPERADVLHDLGALAMESGDYDRAETEFRAALQIDPGNTETRSALDDLVARKAAAAAPARGRARRPELGAHLVEADYAPLGIRGLRVDAVETGSPAARAGLRVGDLLLRADDKPVRQVDDFLKLLRRRSRGLVVDLLRDGKPAQAFIELE